MSKGISRGFVPNAGLTLSFAVTAGWLCNEDIANRKRTAGSADLHRGSENRRAIQANLNRLPAR